MFTILLTDYNYSAGLKCFLIATIYNIILRSYNHSFLINFFVRHLIETSWAELLTVHCRPNIDCFFCFSAHGAGLVSLEVACEGRVISKSVIFEYKDRAGGHSSTCKNQTDTCLAENHWRALLLQKLEALDICIGQDKDIFRDPGLLGTSEVKMK